MKLYDETRQYRDANGMVHRSSDMNGRYLVPYCERYEHGVYASYSLLQVIAPITCVRCLTLWDKRDQRPSPRRNP